MPCLKCENGLWKFGRTGKCEYATKEECESANADYYADEKHDHHFEFTTEQMEELHKTGKLEVKVKEGDEEMIILFTYPKDDEIMDIALKSKNITTKFLRYGK